MKVKTHFPVFLLLAVVICQSAVFAADMPAQPSVPMFSEPSSSAAKKVGRNDPCPCSSGKKYKKCCYPKYGN